MHRMPPALAPILFVPGLLYEASVRARNGLYSSGLLPCRRLPGTVISVGNITMGGTGKTPLVLYIAKALTRHGCQSAILTRGYKRSRSSATLVLSPGETASQAAVSLGDEPAVMRRHLPHAWMGISGNRFLAGSAICRRLRTPVFILDDGFQHRRLHRDLDIVILDGSQRLQSNRVFPRGTLREPVSGLRRSDIVIINGSGPGGSAGPIAEAVRTLAPQASIFRCTQAIESLIPFRAWSESASGEPAQPPRSAFLVAALGNPLRFEQDVRRLGIDVVGTRFFADHHWLSAQQWRACAEDARGRGADAILTTEKDAVKIAAPPDYPLLVSVQTTAVSDEAAFESRLIQCVKTRLGGRNDSLKDFG